MFDINYQIDFQFANIEICRKTHNQSRGKMKKEKGKRNDERGKMIV